ncbi:MAG: DNA translocase FtsK [Opitutaceae bacterium]|nr:DNA translocase FtsK [Opitutaceae bacterium]
MAKKASSNSKRVPSFQAPRRQGKWAWATVCALLSVLLLVSYLDYQPEQSHHLTTDPSDVNMVGMFGSEVSWYSFRIMGASTWLLPPFLIWLGWILLRRVKRAVFPRAIAMILCIISVSALASMQVSFFDDKSIYTSGPGGLIGFLLYEQFLENYLGSFGSGMIFLVIYHLGLLFIITRDITTEFDRVLENFQVWRKERGEKRAENKELKQLAKEAKAKGKEIEAKEKEINKAAAPVVKTFSIPKRESRQETPQSDEEVREMPAGRIKKKFGKPTEAPVGENKTDITFIAPAKTKKANIQPPATRGDYTFPTLDLLQEQVHSPMEETEEEHSVKAEQLLRTLSEFGVEVTLGEIHIGPVITRYEIFPAPGVRVEKISSLDKNIALGMRAQSVRILAPVPGKGCVGVEVPNNNPNAVGIREILESEDWAQASAKLEIPIALGRDVGGKPIISDLTRMPHLLIAGATGAGKTVCINSIITSLLYHSSPEDLRFIMIDPKIVELKVFNDLPHMLIPVVTDPKKVPGALKWLLSEMEQRYQIFAKIGVRNIAGFNGRKKLEEETPSAPTEAELGEQNEDLDLEVPRDNELEIPEKMPYIVTIVDELADLMMVAPADVETGIARLAQLARAAGIHLIIATQRPSTNVITGVIKANLPSRIAFQVASKVDSRVILDSGGAEQLIGRGDMLFSPPASSKLERSQGAFVADEEITNIVDFLKVNGPPAFAEAVQQQIDASGSDEEMEEEEDELYPQALDVLRNTKRASTSMLQRRLRIGYNRAARLMEQLESRGIVGPENGSSPREILVDPDSL